MTLYFNRTLFAAAGTLALLLVLPLVAQGQAKSEWYVCKRDDSPVEIKTNRIMTGHTCTYEDGSPIKQQGQAQPQQQQQQSSASKKEGKQDSATAVPRADNIRTRILLREHERELAAFREAQDRRGRLARQESKELFDYYSLKMESHGHNVKAIREELARLQR